jgi:hypothetical protein
MHPNAISEPTSLRDVLAYRHRGVLRRYCKEHNASEQEAEEVFQQTLKWLYLCYRASIGTDGFACTISPDLEKIDWMWHTFLLFTLDYADFCTRYFGLFIHHVPTEEEDEVVVEEETLRTVLARQYGLVYDVLGEETLTAWYDECLYTAPA